MKLSLILFVFILVTATSACSGITSINNVKKNHQTTAQVCKPLYLAVEKGEINVVKELIDKKSQEEDLMCIKYALQQKFPSSSNTKNRLQAYRFVVEKLIAMKLPDQQIILDDLLQNYAIVYLSDEPEFTEYLLSIGAFPKKPNGYGELPAAKALFIVNDLGKCKTPRLLINASSPKILAQQNKDGETALMQATTNTSVCTDEYELLAKKSAGLNLVDKHGNTALHYLLMKIKERYIDNTYVDDRGYIQYPAYYSESLQVLRILRKRGASFDIANKKSITPNQLLNELRKKGCKC